ncbi:MAG: beta-galactosidase trimerization domain-containing protein, partial [Bryobacteraceae bacterium]
LRSNARYYNGTRSEAKAAVVWSDTTANFYTGAGAQLMDAKAVAPTSRVGNLEAEFSGISEALLQAHVPFDVIDDVTLEREPLGRYKAVFLPNVACMSDTAAARLRDYVRAGGAIFATFETSLYDGTGVRRGDFALRDVFGIGDAHRLAGPRRWDYMRPASVDPLLKGIQREMIPSPAYYVAVSAKAARPVLRYTKPLAGPYDGVPETSGDPALLVNRFGKGKSVYSSGDFGNTIASFHAPELLDIAANTARELSPPAFELSGAPGSVEAVLRSQNDGHRLLLHLVNFTGEMTRPIRRVIPLEHVTVRFANIGPVKKAYTLVERGPVPVKRNAQDGTEFSLPPIAEYEVLVIER